MKTRIYAAPAVKGLTWLTWLTDCDRRVCERNVSFHVIYSKPKQQNEIVSYIFIIGTDGIDIFKSDRSSGGQGPDPRPLSEIKLSNHHQVFNKKHRYLSLSGCLFYYYHVNVKLTKLLYCIFFRKNLDPPLLIQLL